MRKIEIRGEEYPCRVTMGAQLRFKRETGKDIRDVDPNDIVFLMTFIWCCAKSACNADGVEFDVSLELFADLLEPEDVLEFGRDEFEVQKKTKLTAPVVVKEGEQSTRTEG